MDYSITMQHPPSYAPIIPVVQEQVSVDQKPKIPPIKEVNKTKILPKKDPEEPTTNSSTISQS
jgi:hypothetical protein